MRSTGLPGDKTLIMIAHRLSTLRSCDRILVLNQGKVSAFAPWDELERNSLVFREMSTGLDASSLGSDEITDLSHPLV